MNATDLKHILKEKIDAIDNQKLLEVLNKFIDSEG